MAASCNQFNDTNLVVEAEIVVQADKNKTNITEFAGKFCVTNDTQFDKSVINNRYNLSTVGLIYWEEDTHLNPGRHCLIRNEGTIFNKSILVVELLHKDSSDIIKLTRELKNQTLIARFVKDYEPWYTQRKYGYVFVTAFIVIFIGIIVLAASKLITYFKEGRKDISIMMVALCIIVVANVIRIIYFLTGPIFLFDLLEGRMNIFFALLTWPFSLFNLLLISLYWEEIIINSFRQISFLSRFRKVWIIICVVIFTFTEVCAILTFFVGLRSFFRLFINIACYSQIICGGLNIIYCIINVFRISQIISVSDQSQKKKKRESSY